MQIILTKTELSNLYYLAKAVNNNTFTKIFNSTFVNANSISGDNTTDDKCSVDIPDENVNELLLLLIENSSAISNIVNHDCSVISIKKQFNTLKKSMSGLSFL